MAEPVKQAAEAAAPTQGPSAAPQFASASPTPGPSAPPPDNDRQENVDEPECDPEEEYDDDAPQFPITHEVILKDHTKVVSALTLDPSGARVLSGSHDYDCKLWDFGGMDLRCKPFKSWEPAGTYYVRPLQSRAVRNVAKPYIRSTTSSIPTTGSASWLRRARCKRASSTGRARSCASSAYFLCCCTDLHRSAAFIKGDPYIRDMKNTS